MSSQQVTFGQPLRVRNREYCNASDGTQWFRKVRNNGTTTEWEPHIPEELPPAEAGPQLCLWLVRLQQPGPYHWLLAIASEQGGRGNIYQVKGDTVHMHYQHAEDVDVFLSNSYHDSYNMAYLSGDDAAWVAQVANSQPPPRAENAASIIENCQGWTIRVLQELEAHKVVSDVSVNTARGMMEPLH
ncbi:hypothetical protein F4777DRAFT_504207 [Nemania sp. FL0916]|nr:hypothetical protein F4777DRAFT_504207 [Nemania sp. FL0916]